MRVDKKQNQTLVWERCIGLAILAVVGLCGCTTNTDYSQVPAAETRVAPIAPVAVALPPYKVQIGDVLDIKVMLNPELNEAVTVRPDGLISTTMADDVSAYDRTLKEISDNLKKAYGKELKNPRVAVSLRSFAPTRIYVSGEVFQPGEFIVIGPALTLTQAIARAGGIKNSADAAHVLILRRGAGEQSQVFAANYDAATQRGDPAQDARLAPYDVVYVPKTGVAETYRDYQQDIQQFVAPSFGVAGSFGMN